MVAQALLAPGVIRVVASTMAVNHTSRRVSKPGSFTSATTVREWEEPVPGWEHGEAEYERP